MSDKNGKPVSQGAQLLKRWREKNKLSKGDAAIAVRLHPSRYSEIERGVSRPGLTRALRIQERTGGAVPVEAWGKPARKVA